MDDDSIKKSLESMQQSGELDAKTATEISQVLDGKDAIQVSAELRVDAREKKEDDIRAIIGDLTLPQKMKYAMQGNATCRALLVTDSNRLVQQAVMKNPQLRENEIEDFSKNPNISEQVLRAIANNKSWTKSYMVQRNLVTNPKTPQDISLKWLRYLRAADLRQIAKSKNLPQVVATTARKRLSDLQKKQ